MSWLLNYITCNSSIVEHLIKMNNVVLVFDMLHELDYHDIFIVHIYPTHMWYSASPLIGW